MNRRIFLATSTAALLFPSIGCNTTTVAEYVALIAQDAAALANFFGSSGIATQITALAGQIAIDIKNWQNGGAVTDAIQAINDMIALVNSIPIAAPYAPLIDLLLSAIDGLLILLPVSHPSIRAKVSGHIVTPMHYGGFDKKSMTVAKGTFETRWTATLAMTPGLTK